MEQEKDFFLSHASEDKGIMRQISNKLNEENYSTWFDEAELTVGDNLVEEIQKGINISHFVVVLISKKFLGKNWTRAELDTVLNLEIYSGGKKILPVLLNLEQEELQKHYPLIAKKYCLTWKGDAVSIAKELVRAYAKKNIAFGGEEEITIPPVKKTKGSKEEVEMIQGMKDEIKKVINRRGFVGKEWSRAISAQYFLVKIAKFLKFEKRKDFLELKKEFSTEFYEHEGKTFLNDTNILVTPDELDEIVCYMKKEDEIDDYYKSTQRTKAENIDKELLHYNYLYALTLEITNSRSNATIAKINDGSIDSLVFAENEKALDDGGGWQPYRIPWITARILISFKNSKLDEIDKVKREKILECIDNGLQSIVERIYKGKFWRSGVGDWVSNWESTGLCLEALFEWDYIENYSDKVIKILNYTINNQDEWLELNPNFTSDEKSNKTLAAIILIVILLRISYSEFNFSISSFNSEKYLKYLNLCMKEIEGNESLSIRQFCTIPQIIYYILELINEYEK